MKVLTIFLSLLTCPWLVAAKVHVTSDLAHLSSSLELSHLGQGLAQVSLLCQHMIYYNVFIYFIYLCIYYIKKGGLVFEAHLRALKSFK